MTVMFTDIHNEVDLKIAGKTVSGFDFWELLYADDTMIVGERAREINIILDSIQRHSKK